MILAFTPYLVAAKGAQALNVASHWAGGLDLGDLAFRRRHFHNDAACPVADHARKEDR
jgi:hypothetical protein